MWTTLVGIIKSIQILDSWFNALVMAYVAFEKSQGRVAFQKWFDTGDQVDAEKYIGSSNAGKPAQDQGGIRTRPNK